MKFIAKAKINLYLKIYNKRKNGYHNIRSRVTFLDLYDEITITKSKIKKNKIQYSGPFAPSSGKYKNDIIIKLLNFLYTIEKKQFFLNIKIKKNIPNGSGLGGASANAASVMNYLRITKTIKSNVTNKDLVSVGSDVPMCLKSKNCSISGIGENIKYNFNPRNYYFLLIKPNYSLSTKKIYSKYKLSKNKRKLVNAVEINSSTNDLEKIAINLKPSLKIILMTLSKLEYSFKVGMTGSGSCCYAMFKKLSDVKKAHKKLLLKYPQYWTHIAQNNYNKIK